MIRINLGKRDGEAATGGWLSSEKLPEGVRRGLLWTQKNGSFLTRTFGWAIAILAPALLVSQYETVTRARHASALRELEKHPL